MVYGVGRDVDLIILVNSQGPASHCGMVFLGADPPEDGTRWVHPQGLMDHHVQVLKVVHLGEVQPFPNLLSLI